MAAGQHHRFIRLLLGRPRLAGLLVSLHGCGTESHEAFSGVTGSLDETVRNIRLALDAGITVALSTIITRHSLPVGRRRRIGPGAGVQHVAFNRYWARPTGRSSPPCADADGCERDRTHDPRRIAGEVRHRDAAMFSPEQVEAYLAGTAYVAVDPWGRVHPCSHSPSLIGSLHEMSLAQLWRSAAMEAWRALMPPVCTGCAAYAVCHGGCRAVQELRADGRIVAGAP